MMLKSLAFFLLLGVSSALAQPCLKYDPAIVKLKGTIVERKVTSLQDESKWVHYLAVRLVKPVCVLADSLSFLGESNNDAESNVRFVQLVDVFEGKKLDAEYARWKQLAKSGIAVVVSGKIFHADNGNHHTAILIEVMKVKEAK